MAERVNSHASLERFVPQLHAWIEPGEVIPPPEI
jgi:hypothetical protein